MSRKSIRTNAVLNIIKQLCAVIFPLITVPYVTRILRTENYGKINFANSIISYFALLAQLGIVNYGIREGAKIRDRKQIIQTMVNELFSINLLFTCVSLFLLYTIVTLNSKLHSYSTVIIIYSLSIVFSTLGIDWVNNIYEDFLYITIRTIVVQVVSLAMMFVFVKRAEDYLKYVVLMVCSQGATNIMNMFYIRRYVQVKPTIHLNLKKHLKPIIVLFFNNLAMTVYINSDTTMLGFIANDSAVGIYNIATKIYLVVKQVINAIVTVALPRLSAYVEQSDKNHYTELVNEVFNTLITVLFPIITGLFFANESIVEVISGREYFGASSALRILAISLGFAVMAGFFSNCILIPNRRDKYMLYATSAAAIINIFLNFLLIPLLSFNGAALTTVIAEAVVMWISIYYARKIVKVKTDKNTLLSVAVGCILIAFVCIAINCLGLSQIFTILSSVVISFFIYIIMMILFRNPIICKYIKKTQIK